MTHHTHDKRQKGESQDAERHAENRKKHPDEKQPPVSRHSDKKRID